MTKTTFRIRPNYEEYKGKVIDRLKQKVNHAISNNESLLCIGFQLPEFRLSDLSIDNTFTSSAYFNGSQFFGEAFFAGVHFHRTVSFFEAKFQDVSFAGVHFLRLADFRAAHFLGVANFGTAYFHGLASFYETNFHGSAIFQFAHFHILLITPVDAKRIGAWFMQAHFQETADFTEAYFHEIASFFRAKFQGETDFSGAKFRGEADFHEAKFQGETYFFKYNPIELNLPKTQFRGEANFSKSEFYGKTYVSGEFTKIEFNNILIEGREKVIFNVEDLSNISFMNTDMSAIRFSERARWGESAKDRFKILDERLLEKEIKEKDGHTIDFNLGGIKAVYRSLRENYEYRMRYDEAGQFFIREMELKRKYREVLSKEGEDSSEIRQNNWFRRNLFSLTGWYYHLSRYGESIWRPTLAGAAIVFLSTLFWLIQINPSAEPSFTNTVGFANATKITVWQTAFERSMAYFLPILSMGEGIKVGIIDYVIKIVGGAVTFGLIAIALRRRFERRYRH